MIRGAPMGKRFSNVTFASTRVSDDNRKAFEACQRIVNGEILGVVLLGEVGVGKTHLLVALGRAFEATGPSPDLSAAEGPVVKVPRMRELIEEVGAQDVEDSPPPTLDEKESTPEPVIEYWPMLDLASELRAEAIHGELELSRRCRMCDLLIVDDLGREKLTDFILQEFQRIVDWRYREMLPIALASNGEFDDLMGRYGEHTSSRWEESCQIVEVGGEDRRVHGTS